PGGRGIGRLSEVIPRYGAYFRKYLQSMDQAELTKLRSLVRTQIRLRERADGARSAQRQVPADSAVRDDARLQPQVPQANAVETAASDGNVENQNKEEDYSLNDFPHSHSRLENSPFHFLPFPASQSRRNLWPVLTRPQMAGFQPTTEVKVKPTWDWTDSSVLEAYQSSSYLYLGLNTAERQSCDFESDFRTSLAL